LTPLQYRHPNATKLCNTFKTVVLKTRIATLFKNGSKKQSIPTKFSVLQFRGVEFDTKPCSDGACFHIYLFAS
jgi:hypothetical protein